MKTGLVLLPLLALACSTTARDVEPTYTRTVTVERVDTIAPSSKARLNAELADRMARAEVQARLLEKAQKELRALRPEKVDALTATMPQIDAKIVAPAIPTLPSFLEEVPDTMAGDEGCGPLAAAGMASPACAPRL